MTTTVMKMKFKKLKLRIEHYRDYKTKTFSNAKVSEYLLSKLPKKNISPFEQGFSHGVPWWGWGRHFDQNHQKLHENCKNSVF